MTDVKPRSAAPCSESEDFKSQLRLALVDTLDDRTLEFDRFDRRGEGYSWETYLVSVRPRGAPEASARRYAVKREPKAGLLGTYDVQREVDLLNVARRDIRCPVPAVITFRCGSGDERGFYVMEMVDGLVPMPWNVKKILPDASTRRSVGLELADIMAQLHNKTVADLHIGGMAPPADPASAGWDETRSWQAVYLESKSAHVTILDLAFAWLAHRADAVSGRISLVHNDLRVGNVIVKDAKVAAVLDWETAQYTDPSADLAKFNLPTFRGRSSLSSGLIEWSEFLNAYESRCGWRPAEAALNYWTVLEIAKTAVGCLRGVHYFESGKTDDIRYANMRWQAHHSIRWLVELYEAGAWGH